MPTDNGGMSLSNNDNINPNGNQMLIKDNNVIKVASIFSNKIV